MNFQSILFDHPAAEEADIAAAPDCFTDLQLHSIVNGVTAGREQYELATFFHMPLGQLSSVHYRHAIFRDLGSPALRAAIDRFSKSMSSTREYLEHSRKLYYPLEKSRWFIDAVGLYCEAIEGLETDLTSLALEASGWQALRQYLRDYTRSPAYRSLITDTKELLDGLSKIRYRLIIQGSRIEVTAPDHDEAYGDTLTAVLSRFEGAAGKTYNFRLSHSSSLNHIEAAILDRVALLNQDIFTRLQDFPARHPDFLSSTVRRFDREVQFYLAYEDYIRRFRTTDLAFCLPTLSDCLKAEHVADGFDLALASELSGKKMSTVTNSYSLKGSERILVVSGPNQGGKTTFARMFGQLHYLASIGCPVPARNAQLYLCDRVFAHFEREENSMPLSGKLEQELLRMRDILSRSTSSSIIVMNESFSSTSLADALVLSRRVIRQILDKGMLCVCVTFLDEMASYSSAVSMVSELAADQETRTFKVSRRDPNGLAYASIVAKRHRLRYEDIRERLTS